MRSDTDFGMNWNESDWFEMNFNPKLLPGAATAFALGEVRPQLRFPVASRMPTHNSTTCSLSLPLSLSLSIYLSISLCLLYAYYIPGRITRLLTHTVDIQSLHTTSTFDKVPLHTIEIIYAQRLHSREIFTNKRMYIVGTCNTSASLKDLGMYEITETKARDKKQNRLGRRKKKKIEHVDVSQLLIARSQSRYGDYVVVVRRNVYIYLLLIPLFSFTPFAGLVSVCWVAFANGYCPRASRVHPLSTVYRLTCATYVVHMYHCVSMHSYSLYMH